ncbi:MAG: hypothetical protein U5K72_13810 [Balneolaceae bacterium]|nr:hypothetical protein [Balneolaceae bacterium]
MKFNSQLTRKLREMNGFDMRKAGIIILVVGLIITIISGYNYVTKETIVEIGELKVTADRTQSAGWSPQAGVAVMLAGSVVFLVGGKEQ